MGIFYTHFIPIKLLLPYMLFTNTIYSMKAHISVPTGEVWVTGRKIVLRADAIGSCGVIVAYDPKLRIGGVAHIMLPGSSSKRNQSHNPKYAVDAIDELLFKMARLGTNKADIEACLVGGANVLKDNNDTICQTVITSITGLLDKHEIKLISKIVGGCIRRSASLDIVDGDAYYFEGDADEKLLYSWKKI